jgi:branched-chain amino acid transport system permease protein
LGTLGIDRKVLSRVLKEMAPTLADDKCFESLVDDAQRMSPDAAAGHLKSLREWDIRSELSDLNLPVLIVGGQKDALVPAEALQQTAANLPNGRFILWPRVGHTPHLERPDRFIRILMKFIEQHPADLLKQYRKGFCRKWSRYIKKSC